MNIDSKIARYILIVIFSLAGIYSFYYFYANGDKNYLSGTLSLIFFALPAYGFWKKKTWALFYTWFIIYNLFGLCVFSIAFAGAVGFSIAAIAFAIILGLTIVLILLNRKVDYLSEN